MTVEVFRESTDAELDAAMLADLRAYARANAWSSAAVRPITPAELDMLLRIADERDELRRAACEEPESKYVVRECACCGHEPHGYLLPCNRQTCGCRDGRPKP